MDELLKFRGRFPILDRTTYLISNSLGAMPDAVNAKVREYAETWAARGVRAWEETWWDLARQVGEKIGSLLGAPTGTISLHQNVTLTQAVVSSCFDFRGPRNKVVLVDLEFPSIIYFYKAQEARGAQVEMIKGEDGIRVPLDKLLAAIDEQTLLVPISYVLFRSATIVDALAIVERAERVGAHVVLDLYQAAGTVPLDLARMGTHFACGGVLKWLCGGPGTAFLYVRSDLSAKLAPALTGWLAHQSPFDFEVGPIRRTDGAYRFMNGTPQIPALYACQPGLEVIGEAGIERIREKSTRQTERLIQGALARGWRVHTPLDAAERGGTVSVDCPHAEAVMKELVAREILVDYRPQAGVRMSPHFYNCDEEIDFALDQMEEILRTKAWEKRKAASPA